MAQLSEVRPRAQLEVASTFTEILEFFARRGIDSFVVANYCEIARVSRPTFYSRYGNIDGLVAEMWLKEGQTWLDRLIEPDFVPTPRDVGMALIAASAHRKSEVAEVLKPTVERWWDLQTSSKLAEAVAWTAANRLGVLLSANAVPSAIAALSVDSVVASVCATVQSLPAENREKLELANPTFSDRFLDSAFTVVGRVGYHNASFTRIARTAKATTGTLYPLYDNGIRLLETVYTEAQSQIVATNSDLWKRHKFSHETFGSFVADGLSSGRVRWRLLRLETFVAARDPEETLAQMAAKSIGSIGENLDDTFDQAGVPLDLREPITLFFHTLGLGLSVLDLAGIPLQRLSHVAMTQRVASAILERIT